MIRLKASEITLTSADVEETRRRMERRQAANAPASLAARMHRPLVPPMFRACLKRGPMRARDDSITSLGHVPNLRPQQAVHSSIEDPGDPPRSPRDSLTGSSEAVSSELTISPHLSDHVALHKGSTTITSGSRLLFRPVPRLQAASLRVSQEEIGANNTLSSSKIRLTPPRSGRVGTDSSQPGSDENPPTPAHAPTDGYIDHVSPVETPIKFQTHAFRQSSTHAPSALQTIKRVITPYPPTEGTTGEDAARTPESEEVVTEANSVPGFIRSYWDSEQRYKFAECAPRTEPRLRSAQPLQRVRTMSSSSEPSHQPRQRWQDASDWLTAGNAILDNLSPEPSSTHDIDRVQDSTESSNERYWSPLGTHELGDGDSIRNTSGRHSSGTSVTSQPYSFSELADSSRPSSGTHHQPEALAQSQYDGTAPSREFGRNFSRGAYYSIRLSRDRAANGAFLNPPPPSTIRRTSSPDPIGPAHDLHEPSPLPARPYSRFPNARHLPIPSTGLIDAPDLAGEDQDAARAFERDLSSPLELIQERANAYLERISTRMQAASSRDRTAEPRPPDRRDIEEVTDLQRVVDRLRRASGTEGLRRDFGNSSAQGNMNAQARVGLEGAPLPVPDGLGHLDMRARVSRGAPRRTIPASRAGQRSSENAPMSSLTPETRPSYMPNQRGSVLPRIANLGSNVPMRRGELSTLPVVARFDVPQVQRPRDMSNRPRVPAPSTLALSSDDDPFGSRATTPVPSTTTRRAPATHHDPIHGLRIPAPNTSHPDAAPDAMQRQFTRRAVTPIPAPLPFSRQSERGLPSTSTTLDSASGVTSRRTQAAGATVGRRIRHDQENSEETERTEMRGEIAGAEWRVGAQGRMDVMDETPPRMGRHERFMYD